MDLSEKGLQMFFKDWQVDAIHYLWAIRPEGATSREVWINVNQRLQGSISRASIINYLNAMVDEDLLTYIEETGKGGHHRVYTVKYGESDLKQHLAETLIDKLLKEYPEATKKAIKNH